MNSLDPEAAAEWYARLWPEGRVGELSGHRAFLADVPVLFTAVDLAPPGAFDPEAQRSIPQSAFWHLGAFANTTGLYEELRDRGFTVLPLLTGPEDDTGVMRSGLTPYAGIVNEAALDTVPSAEPRPGGFGYLLGPDGALVEVTGGPNTTRSFSHVHLFHEQPACAAGWYVRVLGMSLPTRRDAASGARVSDPLPERCEAERGEPGWPSLEQAGTIRSPRATVVHASGGLSFYPRQCTEARCGHDDPLAPSRGQVLDHVAFQVDDLDTWIEHLERVEVDVIEGPYAFGQGRGVLISGPDRLAIELVEPAPEPADQFFASLLQLCGQAFEGRVVEDVPADPDFDEARMVMHVRTCNRYSMRIPFHVGEDRSRTWVVSRTVSGLRLKHDHRHEDGSEDDVTQYGGDTRDAGTATRQSFPADAFTAGLIPAAAGNVWTIDFEPGRRLTYALRREGSDRRVRVEFDLTQPVEPPPPPWGAGAGTP